jgi:uncharacterized protein (TIGR02594 family)
MDEGITERAGAADHPLIQWWLSLCHYGLDAHDEVAWCSAFVNGLAWELELPRSGSAAARSWLKVGRIIDLEKAEIGFDIVVLNRGGSLDPDIAGPAHVGLYIGHDRDWVELLAGNQSNTISILKFKRSDILGVRRLYG